MPQTKPGMLPTLALTAMYVKITDHGTAPAGVTESKGQGEFDVIRKFEQFQQKGLPAKHPKTNGAQSTLELSLPALVVS